MTGIKTSLDKISALIEVRVTPQRGQGFDNIAERVYKYPEVNAVYLISGGFDLLVTLEGRNLKEISSFYLTVSAGWWSERPLILS